MDDFRLGQLPGIGISLGGSLLAPEEEAPGAPNSIEHIRFLIVPPLPLLPISALEKGFIGPSLRPAGFTG